MRAWSGSDGVCALPRGDARGTKGRVRRDGRSSLASEIRRVLIYRLGSLGDTVVALPCYHLIARAFPDAERRVLTNFPVNAKAPAAAAVLGDSGLIDGYMRYTVGTRSVGELLGLAREIRRFRPDVLIYLMDLRMAAGIRRDEMFFRLAGGVKKIVGVPVGADLERRCDPATGLYESETLRLGRLIRELGDVNAEDRANWDLRLTAAEREAASASLGELTGRPLIVCGPATKMQAKDWERDKWRALLGRLHAAYPEHGLALVGAQEDREYSEYAAEEWAGAKVNLCGRLSPRETAAVMERGGGVCWARFGADAPGGESGDSLRDCVFVAWASGGVVSGRSAASDCQASAGVLQLRSGDLYCDGKEVHAFDHRGRDGAGGGTGVAAAGKGVGRIGRFGMSGRGDLFLW